MHEKVLPTGSRNVLERLGALKQRDLDDWTLAGGTGLALQLGHRVSEDFDFFRASAFFPADLYQALTRAGVVEVLQEDPRTLTALVESVKVSFFSVPDSFLFPGLPFLFFEIAHPRDIALMKLVAISSRGSRKDFVDLYTILRGDLSLTQCFEWLPQRYGEGRLNAYHVLKSLTYFDDADREPMPRMLVPFDWEECKAFFVREAHAIVLP